ncbi:MAG TPA: Rieske 2Fe-2S domain-containing protein [Acidimicrobiia bacterium]|nr:Rieske 2Fe-2S domain-containing protein [Acidimicrobiia bacterium]
MQARKSLPFGNETNALARRIEHLDALDGIAAPASRWVRRAVADPKLKDLLSGTWLGHPVHPALTDLPIGFWTSAVMLDLVGGKKSRRAAQRLVALGALSAVPAAITGASDWSDTEPDDRRVGLVHALLNSIALVTFVSSWRARRRGHHVRGVTIGLLGSAFATVSAHLGGHLVDARGVGVAQTAFDPAPVEWTPVCQELEVSEQPMRVTALGGSVLVVRVDDRIVAVASTCPHRGGPLDEGKVEDGTIVCPWHASRFRLDDGALLQGPSAVPLTRYETRVVDGTVEVRVARG